MKTKIDGQVVQGTWKEITQEKRVGTFLFFVKQEYWKTVEAKTLGHNIHITTDNKINSVFVNGQEFVSKL